MLAWLTENMATIIICAVLIAVVSAIIISMIKNKKREDPPVDADAQTAQ